MKFDSPGGIESTDEVADITNQSLVENENFGTNEEEKERRPNESWDRNRQLNKAFAPRMGHRKACELLQLDPDRPQFKGTNVQSRS
jgi:hypothetical protein